MASSSGSPAAAPPGAVPPGAVPPGGRATSSLWLKASPGLFVVLWSTGFIGARLGMPHAEPLTFLALRFALTAVLLAPLAFATSARWPARAADWGHLAVAGLLMHGVYLGGVFIAIRLGLEAGLSALIVSMQPLLVAVAARFVFGERVRPAAWLGLALGFAGVVLILLRKLDAGAGSLLGVLACLGSLAGITVGTLYQKRYCAMQDLRTGNLIQFVAAGLACGLGAILFETGRVEWTLELVVALAWLVIVLSIGAITLLYILLRQGAASRVASLFFLVPPCTALIAWPLFGERLGLLELLGMALTALGVALVNLQRR